MIFPMTSLNLEETNFANNLYKQLTRQIGLNSDRYWGFCILGMRLRKDTMQALVNLDLQWKSLTNRITSSLINSQHYLNNQNYTHRVPHSYRCCNSIWQPLSLPLKTPSQATTIKLSEAIKLKIVWQRPIFTHFLKKTFEVSLNFTLNLLHLLQTNPIRIHQVNFNYVRWKGFNAHI